MAVTWREYLSDNVGERIATKYSTVFITASFLYFALIWGLQWFMKNRPPYKLKWVSFTWNLSLSLLSGIGAGVFLFYDPKCLLYASVNQKYYHPWVRAVIVVFTLTKALEFGDTALLILKKKSLIFLHVYHHFTVTLYCWHALKVSADFGHHLAFVNLSIHCWMYFYYACTVVLPRHPLIRASRSYITMAQTLQMFFGIWMSWTAFNKETVTGELRFNTICALVMYVSYAYLFVAFYLNNYVRGIRASMAITVGTLHFGALVGASLLWKHPAKYRLLFELLSGYCLSVVILKNFCLSWIASLLSFKSNRPIATDAQDNPSLQKMLQEKPDALHQRLKDDSTHLELSSLAKELSTKLTDDNDQAIHPMASEKFTLIRFNRMLMMLRNPWITWALEPQLLKQLAGHLMLDKKEAIKDCHVECQLPQAEVSLTKNLVLHSDIPSDASTQLPKSLNFFYSKSFEDLFMCSMSCLMAATAGHFFHQQWFLGLLVHGCLRWTIELHTTGSLAQQKINIPKSDYN